jgi:hypothetical protein
MPTRNKERAHGPDLSAVLEGLINADIKFILVGGLAAVVQGTPMTTLDVDIVHQRSSENIVKLLSFLKSIDAVHRRPDDKIIEPTEQDLSGDGHALYSTRFGPLDVLAVIEQGKTYDNLIDYTMDIKFRGHSIKVLDLEMIIELKRTSKNPKDKQQLPVLEETLRQLREMTGAGMATVKPNDKNNESE